MEALAEVEIGSLLAVVHVLHADQVHVMFRARLPEPRFGVGQESLEVMLCDEADIPWQDIAFRSVEFALRRHLAPQRDAVARLVSPGLMQRLGVPIIVENRPGAAGSIGSDAVAKARPDGQTWLLTFDSHATMPALLANLPFNLTRDLDPVMLIGGAPYVIACRADKPFRSLADVVAAAKARRAASSSMTSFQPC